jgi:hypothetical protein
LGAPISPRTASSWPGKPDELPSAGVTKSTEKKEEKHFYFEILLNKA